MKECRARKVVDGFQQTLKSDGDFPLIEPHVLDLEGAAENLEVGLVEADTVTLSGVIRNIEGKPTPGVTVQCGWYMDQGLLEVEYLSTNERGEYSIRVPRGRVPSLQILDQWVFGEMYEPFLADLRSDVSNDLFINPTVKMNGKLKFKAASRSVSDLDWVMVRHQPPTSTGDLIKGVVKWWFWGE